MKSRTFLPLWLIAAAMAVPLLGLTSPLIEVDDARYAQVPAEMVRSGDWILPTLDATPYVEKPPLWYWTAGVSYRLFGVSEAAARLPMWLFSCLGILGVGWLGTWLYSGRVGRTAAAAAATSGLWLFLTHNLTLDMPVSVCLFYATAFALRAMLRPADANWAAPAAWVSAALAFLSKGLIAVLLPGLWVVGLSFLFPKLRPGARRLLNPLGLGLAAAIALPWFIAMQRRRPDFMHVFFVEQHFQRYLTPKYNRGAPWWFYWAVIPGGILPWTAPFLAGLLRSVRDPFGPDARGTALASWVLGVAAFFSTSHSKLATYILPVVPHAAVLAASAIDRGLPLWSQRLSRILGIILLTAAILGFASWTTGHLGPPLWPPRGLPASSERPLVLLAAGLLLSLGLAQTWTFADDPDAALTIGGLCAGFCLFLGLRWASPLISAREIGRAVRVEARADDKLWTYGTYLHGLTFYGGRPVDKLVLFTGEFHYAKRDPAFASRFGDDADVKIPPPPTDRRFVAFRSGETPHFEDVVRGSQIIESRREFGPWTLAVLRAR